jgi:SWI/SNF-related matrix-associated actin-dependent regulator 1 of chromatin subfamily A
VNHFPFQLEGIRWLREHPRALLSDDCGLGKGVQALGYIDSTPEIRRVLVICPATLKLNWLAEARRWLRRKLDCFGIVNYERCRKEVTKREIMAENWDLIILDECHRCKNRKSQITKAILGIRGEQPGIITPARRRLFISATPILNRPAEFWTILNAIQPDEWKSFWDFAKRYCDAHTKEVGYKNPKTVWDASGSSNTGELRDRLKSIMLRRLKKDVLSELPEKRRQIIAFDFDKSLVKAEITGLLELGWNLDKMTRILESGDIRSLNVPDKFKQIGALRLETARAKVPLALEHIKDLLEGGEPIVVFAHHHEVIDALAAGLTEHSPVVLDGRTPPDHRQSIIDAFQGGNSRLFIGGIHAAGLGITLTAASTVVFVELDWTPAIMEQAESRCHRIGTVNPVLVQYLVFDGTIDARIAELLVKKQDTIERIVG